MSQNRRTLGIALITVGLAGLLFFVFSAGAWGFSMWGGNRNSMMGWGMMNGWNYRTSNGTLETVNGSVTNIGWMDIELEANGREVEVHGPSWFWQNVGLKVGDNVTAKGVFVSMMEHMEGWHQELVPYELTVNGKTYGNVTERIPVWMQ